MQVKANKLALNSFAYLSHITSLARHTGKICEGMMNDAKG